MIPPTLEWGACAMEQNVEIPINNGVAIATSSHVAYSPCAVYKPAMHTIPSGPAILTQPSTPPHPPAHAVAIPMIAAAMPPLLAMEGKVLLVWVAIVAGVVGVAAVRLVGSG